MKSINVTHSLGEYKIYVGDGILQEGFGKFFCGKEYDRICIVSDTNVYPLWKDYVNESLEKCDVKVSRVHVFNAGETSKRLSTVSEMYTSFADAGLTRASLVIAIGGGVCGDMAGFAAATYLRGIDIMQVPTTLLSQIDSSIGGKTGVDLEVGKNLVGAFHQPAAVIADSKFLDTLPERYINDGMGEAIKYGCIADKALFDGITDRSIDRAEMIYRCMKIKADVVMADEFEKNIRAILNYGHTIGHAVEKLGGFTRFSHGESVGIGMLYAARVGAAMGYPDFEADIRTALENWNMPTAMDYPKDEILKVAASDKKRTADEIKFIFIEEIGKSVIKKIPLARLAELL